MTENNLFVLILMSCFVIFVKLVGNHKNQVNPHFRDLLVIKDGPIYI